MRKMLVVLWCCAAAVGVASADPFGADKVVSLPAPNPNYTNSDSGTVTLDGSGVYTVMIENELKLENWKEWYIVYNVTPLDQEDWFADLHVDYSVLLNPDQPMEEWQWDYETSGDKTAIWNTFYGGSTTPHPLFWTVVGYPTSLPPQKVDPEQADLFIDTLPFDWNPWWVSLHFEGYNVQIDYEFVDWCLPEPASLSLLSLAGLFGLRRR